jgi:hypothetical protein
MTVRRYDPIGNIRNDGDEPLASSRIISLSGYDAPEMAAVGYSVLQLST